MDNRKKSNHGSLMIIDGSSLLYRAFYALPILTNKKGEYTNAVYGFLNMLIRLLEEYAPLHIGVAFDKKAPTFRHLEFEAYKATRQKMPEELIPQFDTLKKLLYEMRIPIFEQDGYEADDILGTFAEYGKKNGFDVLLVTGDRDALQLVSDHTKVLITKKGISDIHPFDLDELQKEYGLSPNQIVDLKGLMGDKSDNIPGVPGVGEKTALKLLMQYSTVENVLEHIEEINGNKLRENLFTYREQALLSKRLATISRDVPIDIHLGDCRYSIPKTESLMKLLQELEFNSIINRLDFEKVRSNDNPKEHSDNKRDRNIIDIVDVDSLKELTGHLQKQKEIALLLGTHLTIAVSEEKVYRISLHKDLLDHALDLDQVLQILKTLLEDSDIQKITHDGKRLMILCARHHIHLKGLSFDSMIAAYLLEATRSKYDLEQLLYDYLKMDVPQVDAGDLLLLADKMRKRLEEEGMAALYEEIEHPLIEVLASMELEGFKVDRKALEELGVQFSKALQQLTEEIYKEAGEEFNINSTKQLGAVLFDKLKLPVVKKTKTGYSTDVEVLEQLKGLHPIVEKLIDYRQIMKLQSTYVEGLIHVIDPNDGKIHSSFHQTVTATGRISSTDPNLQNIPVRVEMGRQIRRVFVASSPEHVLVDADYSQIELRVLAHISQDETFIDAFKNNQDIHRRTAAEIFGVPLDKVTPEQRSSAKAVNFGIVYGISDYGLARNLGISRYKAKDFIDRYFARYPKVKEYMENIVEIGRKQGYVTTLMGRKRELPELQSKNFNIRSFGERIAMNTPIQGTAADIIKKAMNDVYYALKQRGLRSRMILQVHDELIIDTYIPELDEVKDLVKNLMENTVKLSVPLVVDIGVGRNWYEAK